MYYYAKVTHVDHGIGMVLNALKAKGEMDNTWIIYTSDHGEMLGDHRCSHKALFYESAMNIPLCIRPPGGTKAWQSKALTDQLDLTDTMLEIADAPYLDNASEYRSSLVSKVLDGPDVANAQVGKETVFSDVRLYSMARNDRYKLAVDSLTREPTELYDMDNDSDQIHNLVEDATLDDVRSELMDHLNTHLDKLDHDKVKKYQDTLNANPLLGSAAHRMGTPTVI
jgi:arylsulfatase A-like enzyme